MTRKHAAFVVFWLVFIVMPVSALLVVAALSYETTQDVIVGTVISSLIVPFLVGIPAIVWSDDFTDSVKKPGGRYFYPITKNMRTNNRMRTKYLEGEEHRRRAERCRQLAERMHYSGRIAEEEILLGSAGIKEIEAEACFAEVHALREGIVQREITDLLEK